MARRRRRSRTVFETRSRASGRIRVVDYRVERRLLVSGEILSVYPLDGDWSRVRREYWWRALAAIELPPRPTALFVGLGGGTQIHLLERLARPRPITVIQRGPGVPPPPPVGASAGSGGGWSVAGGKPRWSPATVRCDEARLSVLDRVRGQEPPAGSELCVVGELGRLHHESPLPHRGLSESSDAGDRGVELRLHHQRVGAVTDVERAPVEGI